MLLYNYRRIGGNKEEFERSTLKEICDELSTWVEINKKQTTSKGNNDNKSVKFSYGRAEE